MTYTTRRLLALALAAAVVVATIVLVAVLAPNWDGEEGGSFRVDRVRVTTKLNPSSALVGDPIVATVHVFVDSDRIDPSAVKLRQEFTPFGVYSSRRTVTRGIGHAARVDFTYRLQCVTVSCVEGMERVRSGKTILRPIPIPAGTVSFTPRGAAAETGERGAAAKPARLAVAWRPVILRSRLDTDSGERPEPRPSAYHDTGVSTAISASFLGWLSIGFAGLMALVGGGLVAVAVKGHPAIRRLRIPSHLTPLDRALALVRHAREQGDLAGQRKALERVAAALADMGEPELAERARRLAWSKDGADDGAIEELTRELAVTGNGR